MKRSSVMTIKEIAKEAGYGIGTVSRVLNNNPNVSERARNKVMEVVRAHDFQPNMYARNLKIQAIPGIAIIVRGIQNMLFCDLVEHLQMQIENNGMVCLVFYLDEDADEAAEARRICSGRRPSGIIFLGSNLDQHVSEIEKLGVPCLSVTETAGSYGIRNLSSIGIDDVASGEAGIEYLVKKGHRQIGIIGGLPDAAGPSGRRFEGCMKAFLRHGIPFDRERQYAYSRFSMKGGYSAANELIDRFCGMTAVFSFADITAAGVIRAIYDRGLRVPYDISVIGFDGIELTSYMSPRLTTIYQDVPYMAEKGMELLLNCIRNQSEVEHEVVKFELIERESVRDLSSEEITPAKIDRK